MAHHLIWHFKAGISLLLGEGGRKKRSLREKRAGTKIEGSEIKWRRRMAERGEK